MADKTAAADKDVSSDAELQALALDLFRTGRNAMGSPKQIAIKCFRDAAAFRDVMRQIMSNEIDVFFEDNNPLDQAHAPNLKKTHPLNLMSQAWGSIEKVRNTLAALEAAPTDTIYDLYGWGAQEVSIARFHFPEVIRKAEKAKQVAVSK